MQWLPRIGFPVVSLPFEKLEFNPTHSYVEKRFAFNSTSERRKKSYFEKISDLRLSLANLYLKINLFGIYSYYSFHSVHYWKKKQVGPQLYYVHFLQRQGQKYSSS